jgi:hypothetical protein
MSELEIKWKFVADPPDQSSSDDDWYALSMGGAICPEEILDDAAQIAMVRDAEYVIASFFEAIRAAGIREEM